MKTTFRTIHSQVATIYTNGRLEIGYLDDPKRSAIHLGSLLDIQPTTVKSICLDTNHFEVS